MGALLTPPHLMVIAVTALVLFGGKKLPELGKWLGEGLRGFKDGIKGLTDELRSAEVIPAVAAKPKTTAFRQATAATQRRAPSRDSEWL
jgi:sec-independent protein translocase protein TatA